MSTHSIYYKWVPEAIKLPLLIIAMFPFVVLLSLFHTNTTFTASFLEVEMEHIQFFLTLTYAAIVVALLVFGRFVTFFRLRTFIIIMNTMSVVLLYAVSKTTDIYTLGVLRILEGLFAIMEGACMLPLVVKQLKTKNNLYVGYMILYAFMITGGTFTTHLVKYAIEDYGWDEMMKIFIYLHLLTILIALIILNNNRLSKKIPLYQIDWASCVFLLVSLVSGSFVLVFGRKLYWFEDPYINMATGLFCIFSALFILKQRLVKRPIYHFEILKKKNVIIGICLFFSLYILRAALGNVYGMMSKVWKWPWENVLYIQYINVGGTFLGIILSGILLFRDVKTSYLFAIGFALLAIDCFWFVEVCYPDSSYLTVGMPLFLQGVGVGFVFTPIAMSMIANADPKLVSNISLTGTATRFWGNNFGFMVIQNFTYDLNQKHFVHLIKFLDSSNRYAQNSWDQLMAKFGRVEGTEMGAVMAAKTMRATVMKQATLLTNMEIFTMLGYMCVLVVILIFITNPTRIIFKKMIRKFNYI